MSQMMSEVVGVIEMDLDADELRHWLDQEVAESAERSTRTPQQAAAPTPAIVIADVAKLSDDLRVELSCVLQRLLNSR